jgi:hypothetical protein
MASQAGAPADAKQDPVQESGAMPAGHPAPDEIADEFDESDEDPPDHDPEPSA